MIVCQVCGASATMHITERDPKTGALCERHLCEACARKAEMRTPSPPALGRPAESTLPDDSFRALASLISGYVAERLRSEPPRTESVTSARGPESVGAYPHAKRVGNLLFLSGMGPRQRGSAKIPGVELDEHGNVRSYDIAAQSRAVFENVRLILEDAGSAWENIIDVTAFLTNLKDDFALFNRVYAEYFAGEGKPNPTRTTVEVTALPTPIAIELKVVATVA